MKKLFPFFLLSLALVLLNSMTLYPQVSRTDSLEQASLNASDSNKVKILIRLCAAYSEKNPDLAIVKGENALTLARTLNYNVGEIRALNALGDLYAGKNDPNKAFSCYKNSLELAKKHSCWNRMYDIYSNIALLYLQKNDFDSAHQYYGDALKITRETNDKTNEINALNDDAGVFIYQAKYDKALENYLEALKKSEAINFQEGIALSSMGIGSAFNQQMEYDKALRFYGEALSANEMNKDSIEIGKCQNNIGTVYEEKKEYEKALDYYQRALKLKEKMKDKSGMEKSLSNIGNIYLKIKEYDKSIEFYNRANKLAEENNNKGGMAKDNINLGNLFVKKKDFEKALTYLNKGLQLAKEIGSKEFIRSCYEELAEANALKSDYKTAYDFQRQYVDLNDSIFGEQNSKNMAEMQTKYETDKKEKEIALQKSELGKQTIIRNSLIVGVLLVILLTFQTYTRYRVKKKGNELLSAANAELDILSLVAKESYNGVMICEGDGTILFMNHGIYRMLGYTLEDVKSQFGNRLQDFSHNPTIDRSINEAIEKKIPVYYESLSETKAGSKIWVATTLTPILNEKGILDKIVVIDVDIHDNKLKSLQIEEQGQEIQKSINYARQIQEALLPDLDTVIEGLPGAFVFYRPKDVVSGDFYWYANWNNTYCIAAINCTGHGVPGAFMSVMAHNILSQMTSVSVSNRPGYVLENLHETVRSSLKQHRVDSSSRDGMDVAFCRISTDKKTLEFAGAMRPMYHVRGGILTEIKGDKFSIGGYQTEERRKFTTHTLELEKGDSIYIFSDGYADQFGGPDGKKFMTKRMKELVVSISPFFPSKQRAAIEKAFSEWKGNMQQVDDILVFGVKF